jgi:threonine aldolase
VFTSLEMSEKIRRPKLRAPRSAMVVIEQTANRSGGTVWPIDAIQDVSEFAHDKGLAVHMDGARVLNATVASGIPAREYGRHCDSVWLDFTKGLGCPLGAVLAGSRAFIEQAWLWKHRLGGAMRQSGISAAACRHALAHNVSRLATDHANAKRLADGLRGIPGLMVQEQTETNIVMVDLADGVTSGALTDLLQKKNVRLSIEGEHRVRAVTHLDISAADVDTAVQSIAEAMQEYRATNAESSSEI